MKRSSYDAGPGYGLNDVSKYWQSDVLTPMVDYYKDMMGTGAFGQDQVNSNILMV